MKHIETAAKARIAETASPADDIKNFLSQLPFKVKVLQTTKQGKSIIVTAQGSHDKSNAVIQVLKNMKFKVTKSEKLATVVGDSETNTVETGSRMVVIYNDWYGTLVVHAGIKN